MLMLRRVITTSRLLTPLLFNFHRKPRPANIPTQSEILLPFTMNNLRDNPGAKRKPKILGRGHGSGKGKTSGRGHKGNKARSGGGVSVRFEGGQTPIHRRLPKYGRGKGKKLYPYLDYLNIGKLQYYIDRGVVNSQEIITIKTLQEAGAVKKVKHGLKILGRGRENFKSKITIEVSDASKEAVDAIKQLGGDITLIYRMPFKFREFMNPSKHPIPLREPIPDYQSVRKLEKIASDRNVKVVYRKPTWKIQEEEKELANPKLQPDFVYPVSREPNPEKIHMRRQKLWKKITYKL